MIKTEHINEVVHNVRAHFLEYGRTVDRGEWQGKQDERPQTRVFEVHDISFRVTVPLSGSLWQDEVKPNLPWAEDHFQERVAGEPLNPGEQYKNWPWYKQGVEEHKETGMFSHTYMERFWCSLTSAPWGIHAAWGDLFDLVELLKARPYSRQAYLPIWFPEDLMQARQSERVPCTLGYLFQAVPPLDSLNKAPLKATYYMRSCDWFRYFRDDVYMAGRLLQWVAGLVGMVPTTLTVHIANLHIFNDEVNRLSLDHRAESEERLNRAFR